MAQWALCWPFLACAASPRSPPAGGPVVDRGGELRVADMPAANVERDGESLVVWGMTEVPAGSRLQAALALVDAVTRAEFVKLFSVTVASCQLDVADEIRQSVELKTAEAVRAQLPGIGPLQHGWEQLRSDSGPLLRIVARLQISRLQLRMILQSALGPAQPGVADAIVASLFRRQ